MENSAFSQELMPALVIGVLIMILLGIGLVIYIRASNQRLMTEYKAKQDLLVQHQDALIENNITSQEKERHRIAEDLHDDIGSKLNVILLYLHQVKTYPQNPQSEDLLLEIDTLIAKVIQSIRVISHNLMPPTLSSLGLFSAVQELAEDISKTNRVEMSLQMEGDTKIRLDNALAEISLFRIIQEWISNSLKQSVSTIIISLSYRADRLEISFEDDGPGYDPKHIQEGSGMGLRNIENRVRMIGAMLDNLCQQGHGARYMLTYKNQQL